MPVDRDVERVLEGIPLIWHDMTGMTVERARQWVEGLNGQAGRAAMHETVRSEDVWMPAPHGEMRLRLHVSQKASPEGTVLWFRGSGFVLGSIDHDNALATAIAVASGCVIVSVDYPMAPEHPYPAAPMASVAAARWVSDHADEIGGGLPLPLVVAGESAGGNLAAVVALIAREEGGPEIVFQALVNPMLAREFDGDSRHDAAAAALAPWEALEWLWKLYLGDADGADPMASPLMAETLADLPPALIITAENDVLRDEGEAFAARLSEAGVSVELKRFTGMPHGFATWGGLKAADDCIELIGQRIRAALTAARPDC